MEIGRVMSGRVSDKKYLGLHGWANGLLFFSSVWRLQALWTLYIPYMTYTIAGNDLIIIVKNTKNL